MSDERGRLRVRMLVLEFWFCKKLKINDLWGENIGTYNLCMCLAQLK